MKRHLLVLLILPNMLIAKGFNPEFDQFSGPVWSRIGEALDRYNQTTELAKSRSEEKPKVVAPVSTPKPTAPAVRQVVAKDSNGLDWSFALVPQQPASSATTSAASNVVSVTQSSNSGAVTNAVAVVAAGVPSAQSSQTTPVATAGVLTPKNSQPDKPANLTSGALSSSSSSGQRPPVKPAVKNSLWYIFKICGCR